MDVKSPWTHSYRMWLQTPVLGWCAISRLHMIDKVTHQVAIDNWPGHKIQGEAQVERCDKDMAEGEMLTTEEGACEPYHRSNLSLFYSFEQLVLEFARQQINNSLNYIEQNIHCILFGFSNVSLN